MNTVLHLRHIVLLFAVALLSTGIFSSCQSKKETETQSDTNQNLKKKWKLTTLKYEDLQQTEDSERGLLAGLRDIGLVEGKDFDVYSRSAQGDIATVLGLVDALSTDGTDIIVSMQTTTLHTAIKRSRGIPLVFMVVANPFVVSTVGESDSVHLPFVTGVYTNTTFDRMVTYIKQCLPKAKRVGTLYSTSELNATYYKSQLVAACNKAGLEVESFGVTSRVDVQQSMQALCAKKLDAICQIEDNLTSATFPIISKVAERNKLPVFSFVNAQATTGSSLVLAPDYYESAKEAATMISKIMHGASPATIPFQRIMKFHLLANLKSAKTIGLKIPESIISQADKVIPEE